MLDCQQIDEMLSGYLDGELTQGDRQRVDLHLESCSRCRGVYEELADLRQAVGEMSFGEISREEWSKIMNDLPVRTSRGAGWLLYVAGFLIVCGYGFYEFMADDTVNASIKTGIGALVIGTLLLFVSVLRERLIARRTDKYKDVEI
jgi:predicted anti-sigma-YlaC factor YlaD